MNGKWAVRSDGGHLWLVIDSKGRVNSTWNYWTSAVHTAQVNARWQAAMKSVRGAK